MYYFYRKSARLDLSGFFERVPISPDGGLTNSNAKALPHCLLDEAPASRRVVRQLATLAHREHELQERQAEVDEELNRVNTANQKILERERDLEQLNRDLIQQHRAQVDHLRDEIVALRVRNQELEQARTNVQTPTVNTPSPVARTSSWVPLPLQQLTVSDPIINRPPARSLNKPSAELNTKLAEGTCVICFGSLTDAASLVSVKCGHVFCEICLYTFIRALDRNRRHANYFCSQTDFNCPSCAG
ncbi:hypothetical protein BpHYR1_011126 [Brachionus plicatilis]|uniref:RING-type domain-containing protein n=1 Tax=Brachionus plicatilis TaxID=10195 RepID=A0A3M7P3G0_BRAPC|nr:hypothetical protein BpHYR1_011126 [Brachionus plicatilis]